MRRRARAWLGARAFNSRLASWLWRRQHVLCLGDSHVQVFGEVVIPGIWFRVFSVRGATASGIQNPNSATDARRRFQKILCGARSWQHVVVNLGEVDCNFVLWRRAERTGTSTATQLETALESYAQFLHEVHAHGFASVTVLSATLPTIEDYQSLKEHPGFDPEVMGFRSQIQVSCEERIRLTDEFNRGLAERCAAAGIRFLDTTAGQLDPVTGRVKADLLFDGGPNIHLDSSRYAELLREALERGGGFLIPGVGPRSS